MPSETEGFPEDDMERALRANDLAELGIAPLPSYRCGNCGLEFGSNCDPGDISCPECEASMCPHCKRWFGGDWDGEHEDSAPGTVTVSPGAEMIAAERQRQVAEEGWTRRHDDSEHDPGDLARASRAYLTNAVLYLSSPGLASARDGVSIWPFEPEGFKPGPTPLRTLVKAGALIAAEIDRIQAATGEQS